MRHLAPFWHLFLAAATVLPAGYPAPMRPFALLLLAACTADRAAPVPAGQAVLDLSGAFAVQPWTQSRGSAGPLRLSGRFILPEDRVGAGSVLELEGLWWTAAVTLNGVELPPVTGGNATVRLPLGAALKAGENELLIEISPPTAEMPIQTGGGLSSSGFPADQPTLQAAPRLVLRPSAHVDWLAVGAQDGPAAGPISGAAGGATVSFSVWDGAVDRPLGQATVGADGRATAPPVAWPLDWWAPGDPALYMVSASLEAGGRPLDRLSQRTGLRAVTLGEDGGLRVNGAPHRLVGARVTNRPDLGDLATRFAALLPAGVNALEIHGELPRSTWLNLADEVGLPVVLLPRCVGRTRRGSTASPATFALQEAQDRRFLVDLVDHPGVLLWVGEGPSARTQRGQAVPLATWTPVLLEDPLQRPIVQEQLPDRFLQVPPHPWRLGRRRRSAQRGPLRAGGPGSHPGRAGAHPRAAGHSPGPGSAHPPRPDRHRPERRRRLAGGGPLAGAGPGGRSGRGGRCRRGLYRLLTPAAHPVVVCDPGCG